MHDFLFRTSGGDFLFLFFVKYAEVAITLESSRIKLDGFDILLTFPGYYIHYFTFYETLHIYILGLIFVLVKLYPSKVLPSPHILCLFRFSFLFSSNFIFQILVLWRFPHQTQEAQRHHMHASGYITNQHGIQEILSLKTFLFQSEYNTQVCIQTGHN